MTSPVLEVSRIRKVFGGVVALEEVSFAVAAGEMVALIGPNGAGKSTCFNVVNGQLRPDEGHVALHGRAITGLPARKIWRLGVGRTFQVAATFASMTVMENVQMALLSRRRRLLSLWPRATRLYRGEALELLERVGAADLADRPCGQLAYGDVKRIELAIALANEPALLLMDEPTAGMAPGERAELMALTAAIAREGRIAVLFTEHDMDVVFGHADRVLVLDRGHLIAAGEADTVRNDPRVREVYLGPETLAADEAEADAPGWAAC
ncbi:ABC transporter ATP-binding protein [Ferruginivarius sediminum]|uniref:ABC transporter ATP-binding protein n=1 Tax=Ferruginivarius sediminum TaxID=2661937 RepID=A0A369TIL1_9PROT|nr:ABC transporter ATP-binding protein [Ferruginivarius sediminum]RDD62716.1 ABC transporter ATP-binding protein [Ferruginivarius sediminum]